MSSQTSSSSSSSLSTVTESPVEQFFDKLDAIACILEKIEDALVSVEENPCIKEAENVQFLVAKLVLVANELVRTDLDLVQKDLLTDQEDECEDH